MRFAFWRRRPRPADGPAPVPPAPPRPAARWEDDEPAPPPRPRGSAPSARSGPGRPGGADQELVAGVPPEVPALLTALQRGDAAEADRLTEALAARPQAAVEAQVALCAVLADRLDEDALEAVATVLEQSARDQPAAGARAAAQVLVAPLDGAALDRLLAEVRAVYGG